MLHVPCRLPTFISTYFSSLAKGAKHRRCVCHVKHLADGNKLKAWRNTWQWATGCMRRVISHALSAKTVSEGGVEDGLGDPKLEAVKGRVHEIEAEADTP